MRTDSLISNKLIKPIPASVVDAGSSIYYLRKVEQPSFSHEFHFHEECQLVYIIKGSGKRIIGDSVEDFSSGELVFLGSNLPHVWKSSNESQIRSVSLSLFISAQKFKEHLSAFGDVRRTDHLFQNAKRGILITGTAKKNIVGLLGLASKQHGFNRVITLLCLTNILERTNEYRLLASPNYVNCIPFRDNERMKKVYDFLIKNFTNDIQFHQIADLAGMNPNAFCRFFKSQTQKSLTQFINEMRIGHACKLLIENDVPISQIAYECGYNNVSNFNHFFKVIKNVSPTEYRKGFVLPRYA